MWFSIFLSNDERPSRFRTSSLLPRGCSLSLRSSAASFGRFSLRRMMNLNESVFSFFSLASPSKCGLAWSNIAWRIGYPTPLQVCSPVYDVRFAKRVAPASLLTCAQDFAHLGHDRLPFQGLMQLLPLLLTYRSGCEWCGLRRVVWEGGIKWNMWNCRRFREFRRSYRLISERL